MNKKILLKKAKVFIFATMIVPLFAISATAQTGTSSIRGTVADPQGKFVAGATVTLKSETKSFTRTQTTNDSGGYVFTAIPPDKYQIEVEANGFKKASTTSVNAFVDTPTTIDVTLEVGSVSETVTITGGADTVINTSDATLGIAFDSQRVITLPLSARNTPGLLSLQPGVVPDTGSGQGGQVNGGRSDQANVTLDGVDVNEQQGGRAFFSVLRVTPEELQEFRVVTTNANADSGRSSGAQISLITRSGSNEWHGSVYEYYRPKNKFQANNWFNNKAGVAQPSILRHNFGGSVLGPIKKDKLFFSAFYERFQEDSDASVTRTVPLASLGQGIVRYRSANGASGTGCPTGTPSGVICLTRSQISSAYLAANGIDPGTNTIAIAALASAASRYPANDPTFGDGLNTGGFRFNAPTPIRNNSYTFRLDGVINEQQSVFARFKYQWDHASAVQRFPDTPSPTTWIHPWGVATGHNWTISNNKVNRFTYGLTRDSFTIGGDSTQNFQSFRFVFQPFNYSRTVSRVTPVHNFVDDFSWVKGNHTIGFGGNVRLIENRRLSFGSSFDNAITNPSFYDFSGDVVLTSDAGNPIFGNLNDASATNLRDALTAVIGRYSQFGVNLQYGADKRLQTAGNGVARTFATQEYEFYVQDSWRARSNLTLYYGLRWSSSQPIYEKNGLQVKPTRSLNDYFNSRAQAAFNGQAFNDLITVDLAGKANGKEGYYKQDWNNFAPAVAVAWSPKFRSGVLGKIFGDQKTTIRGGFRMTYDRIGSALAVAFDLNSTLGFSSSKSVAANTYNVSDRLGPLFTGFGQNVRALPGITIAPSLSFPLQTPADEDFRIEQSLDDKLTTPYNYSFNLTYARDFGKGWVFEGSYVGRIARDLLVSRDVMHFNNLRDPATGEDFYSVMRKLLVFRDANTPISNIPNIPWVNKFVPGLAGTYNVCGTATVLTATQAAYRRVARASVNNAGTTCLGGRNTNDYTFVQLLWDDGLGFGNNIFIQPQYATFAAYSTIGTSDYHGLQLSLRKRLSRNLTFDINYSFSHSLDTASGNESSGTISSGASLILNPLNLNENRADSDFDIRHLVSANFIWNLPFGRGEKFGGGISKVADYFIGGWQLTGIFRYNSGLPAGQPFDDARWATNWNVQSNTVATTDLQSSPTRTGDPNLFSDPTSAFRSYRNAYPGEAGDRNILRDPSYITLDMGVYKNFKITEKQRLTLRLEVFNVANKQAFTGVSNFGLPLDPKLTTPPAEFGRFTAIQGSPRVTQFAIRYEF